MLELKELADLRENAKLERVKIDEKIHECKQGNLIRKKQRLVYNHRNLHELRINELYNPQYRQEKEIYLKNLEAQKAYCNLLNKC